PGRTFKGKKMAGHMGHRRVTTLNLVVVSVDAEQGLIFVRGSVPGAEGGFVRIRDGIKNKKPKGASTQGAKRDAKKGDKKPEAKADKAA
ncbi:MAG TPA: 50S ribosomal protein L3, partial [Alphaproteobacteria bacterium]|nr:50S ribosomal protein L3 [Alphaproteobacteria bacterium]